MPLTQATRHRGRGSNLAEHAPLDDYHRHRGLVQRRIAGRAGLAHGDTAVAAIDCGAQRRADAHLAGDAGDDQRVDTARGQDLLKRGVFEGAVARLVDYDFTGQGAELVDEILAEFAAHQQAPDRPLRSDLGAGPAPAPQLVGRAIRAVRPVAFALVVDAD